MSAAKPIRQFEPLPGQEYATPVPPLHKLPVDEYGKVTMPTTVEELEAINKPSVLISGGGIGGLTLALLLHKADIPFLVLERAKEIKPLGSAMSFGAAVGPLFKQLGIWDEFVKRGKPFESFNMHNEDLTPSHSISHPWLEELVGYEVAIISRSQLYDLLFNCIPRDRILLGKRVLSSIQNRDSVMVRCSDNSSYHGDILVGADGAYSAVRQNLYRTLKEVSKLPSSDDVTLPFSCVCLVGQTIPLNPEEFEHLKGDLAECHSVLGISTRCSWLTFTTRQNTVCWMVMQFLDKYSAKRNDSFRTSEWGPEAAEALAREVRVFKVPGTKNGQPITLAEYVDKTPGHLMSKVVLEEIVFDTWYSGRTVLLGDSCHKMNPSGGAGAINAIHDAVALANWLATLRLPDDKEILQAFKEYKTERYPVAKAAFETSQMFTKNLGKNFMSVVVRGMMKRLPVWLWKKILGKMYSNRVQASFLPLIEDNFPVKPMYQRSLHKTLPIVKKLLEKRPVVAKASNVPTAV